MGRIPKWPINPWKDAQHHSLLDKCKSEPQWDITSHQSKWPSSKNLQTINAGEIGEKGTLLHCWWEYKLIQPLYRFFKKLKIELPYDPVSPLLGIYPKKNMVWKDTYTLMFIAVLFPIAETWKQPKCPLTDEGIKKIWFVYTLEY